MTTLQKFKEDTVKKIVQKSINHIHTQFNKNDQKENKTVVISEKNEKFEISKKCFDSGEILKEYYEEYTIHYDGIVDGKKIFINPCGRFWLHWKNDELVPIYKINISCKTMKPSKPTKTKLYFRFKFYKKIFSKFLQK